MCYLNVLDMKKKRERWRGAVRDLKDGVDEYETIKGYYVRSDEIEKETMRYLRVIGRLGRDMKDGETVD